MRANGFARNPKPPTENKIMITNYEQLLKANMVALMRMRDIYPDDYKALRDLALERFPQGYQITIMSIAETAMDLDYFDDLI